MDKAMQMIADGLPYREVSKKTGITLSLLHHRFQATGLPRKHRDSPKLKDKTDQAARKVLAGATYDDACAETGATKSSVWRRVQLLRKLEKRV